MSVVQQPPPEGCEACWLGWTTPLGLLASLDCVLGLLALS